MKTKFNISSASNSNNKSGKSGNKKRCIMTNSQLSTPENANEPFNGKKILDYFSITSVHKSKINELSRQTVIVKQKIPKNQKLTQKYLLMTSPSKQGLNKNDSSNSAADKNYYIDIEKVNFFNEDHVNTLFDMFNDSIIPEYKRVFSEKFEAQEKMFISYDEKMFDKFVYSNLKNIISKYLIMTYDKLFYIPKSFITGDANTEKKNLKLIGGFNDRKNIHLEYHPINIEEGKFFYSGLTKKLTQYISSFRKKIKKKIKTQNALVLYNSGNDLVENVKTIETICEDLGYLTIRLDELENNKCAKFNKTSEATKSQRISSLSEDLISKIRILHYLAEEKGNNSKWIDYLNSCGIIPSQNTASNNEDVIMRELENNDTQMSSQQNQNTLLSVNLISKVNNFRKVEKNDDSFEYKMFDNFQRNIFDISLSKRTLILIVDTFSPVDDENKQYLSNIISKIPATKCPIVILTNNLSIFNSISPPSNISHFDFYKIDNEEKENIPHLIYLLVILIYFHLYIKKSQSNEINEIIKDINENNLKNSVLKLKFLNNKIFGKIVKIAIRIAIEKRFNFEAIMNYLSMVFRKLKAIDLDDKILYLEKYTYDSEDLGEDDYVIDFNNEMGQMVNDLESVSFADYKYGKIKKLSYKKYSQLSKNKINYALGVNIEQYFIEEQIGYEKESGNFNDIYESKKFPINNEISRARYIENKQCYFLYSSTHNFLSKQSINLYNDTLLCLLYKVSQNELLKVLNMRRTRNKDNINNSRINYLIKLFNKIPTEQIERLISSLDINKAFIEYPKSIYYSVNEKVINYFKHYHYLEQITSNQKKDFNTLNDDTYQDIYENEESSITNTNEEDDFE